MAGSTRATREQLGAANIPDAHGATAPITGLDPSSDEFVPGEVLLIKSFGEQMRWRGPQSIGAGPGPATDAGGEYGVNPSSHATPGTPDARRVWRAPVGAGYPGTPPDLQTSPELASNTRSVEPVAGHGAPVRHRGGPTSEDAVRPGMFNLAMFMRPFDKWTADNFSALDKIESASPLATSPYTAPSDVLSREPSPGGGMASPGFGPNIGASPNTYRIIPRGWDELLINTGMNSTGQSVDSGRRASGWRTRG